MRALEECLAVSRELGDKVWMAAALAGLGRVARAMGDYSTAHARFSEALNIQQETEGRIWVAPFLDDFASLAVAYGQAPQAVRLLGAAAALREALGINLKAYESEDHERTVAAARKQLSDAEFEAAWAEGRGLSVKEAIEDALSVPVPNSATVSR